MTPYLYLTKPLSKNGLCVYITILLIRKDLKSDSFKQYDKKSTPRNYLTLMKFRIKALRLGCFFDTVIFIFEVITR